VKLHYWGNIVETRKIVQYVLYFFIFFITRLHFLTHRKVTQLGQPFLSSSIWLPFIVQEMLDICITRVYFQFLHNLNERNEILIGLKLG